MAGVEEEELVRTDRGQCGTSRDLWATGRTWAFALNEMGTTGV